MRLLNTSDLTFSECLDLSDVRYAVLSHHWYAAELTYLEMCSRRYDAAKEESYAKVRNFCNGAKKQGCGWAWVDTVCIDKSSSAEFQEAINSMWTWYRDAFQCIIYFSDVDHITKNDMMPRVCGEYQRLTRNAYNTLSASEWFTRGWTLQELLASKNRLFYNAQWQIIGDTFNLAADLEHRTGIPKRYLLEPEEVHSASVATRMSWAARRRTTRIEDRAYSLLGLFNVNMPLLYGEGRKAFLRLQLAILEQSDDESIFAWSRDLLTDPSAESLGAGMLAIDPEDFAESGTVDAFPRLDVQSSFKMTNKGLKVRLPIVHTKREIQDATGEEMNAAGHAAPTGAATNLPLHPQSGDRLHLKLHCGFTTFGAVKRREALCIELRYTVRGWQRFSLAGLRLVSHECLPESDFPTHVLYVKQPGIHMPYHPRQTSALDPWLASDNFQQRRASKRSARSV